MKLSKNDILALLLISNSIVGYTPQNSLLEQHILELLNYTSNVYENFGKQFPAGYHTIKFGQQIIQGERNPYLRIKKVPYDFKDKIVLDLGTNTGGMLFAVADKIKYGIGIDYNMRTINVANLLKAYYNTHNISFFCFDLEKESTQILKKFLSTDRVDICFLLSMCAWIKNWRDVINFVASISDAMLFEIHGESNFQSTQLLYINKFYKNIILISKYSDDDPINRDRALYLCKN